MRETDPDLGGERSRTLDEVGFDVKYSLTPGLTLDGTYTTDFAQVEADEEQVNRSFQLCGAVSAGATCSRGGWWPPARPRFPLPG